MTELSTNTVKIDSNHVVDIKTVQSSAIKILVESLKEILTDANFIIDENGIKLIAMDSTHSVLVYLKLDSDKFESFYCKEKIKIGVSMINLYKLIKTISTNDTLTFFIDSYNEIYSNS